MESPAPKKIIKRRRRCDPNDPEAEKKRKARQYFNEDTQEAILEHLRLHTAGRHAEANALYTTLVFPAFMKMAENLIRVMKIQGYQQSHEDLQANAVSFLYQTLSKWDPHRGTPAFSYFNMVARNFLINEVKNGSKECRRFGGSLSSDPSDDDFVSMSAQNQVASLGGVERPDAALLRRERLPEMMQMLDELEAQLADDASFAACDAVLVLQAVRTLMGRDVDELRGPGFTPKRRLMAPQLFPLVSAMTGITDRGRFNKAIVLLRKVWGRREPA